MERKTAYLGLMNEDELDMGRTIVTTRAGRFQVGMELHLFSGGHVCKTVVEAVEESKLRLLWDQRLWTLTPWLPGDAAPPGAEDDGATILKFWTVRAAHRVH